MTADIEKLIKPLIANNQNSELIRSAFDFAKEAYKNKTRASGENYIFHSARVAKTLDEMGLDTTTIAFGILHDILDGLPEPAKTVGLEQIKKTFGRDIAELIEKISGLDKIRHSLSTGVKENNNFNKEKIENLRKMFLALSGDLRVIIVELASRLDGLSYLNYMKESYQKLSSLETLQIFVPIANRLGLSEIRRKMEDVAFSYLYPDKFNWVKENIKSQYEEREKYLKKFIPQLKKIFEKERVKYSEVSYRAKSYWSTYKKLLNREMNFSKVYDLLALRIITKDIPSCYRILGIIHKYFKPISEEINDYIAKPKPNGYRSLHTTVYSTQEKITEIQIRTEEMQKEAEYGVCAHWSYKEKIDLTKENRNFEWVKNTPDFWKSFKIDFFTDKVFVLTPMGDVRVLPKDSTPIDFAYTIHSSIGNACELAKINGKIAQLDSTLNNGDIVEIKTNKNKKPSLDWLKFVKTSMAKSHIKKATEEKSGFKLPLPGFIRRTLEEFSEASRKRKEQKQLIQKEGGKKVFIAGQTGILLHLAKCCDPQPGEKIKAYIAKNRATVLHRSSCSNLRNIKEKYPDRIVDASWK